FIEAGLILFVISAVVIGIGTLIFFRVSEPMVAKIMESEALKASSEKLVQAQGVIREKAIYMNNILSSALDTSIVATDENFLIRYFNPTAEKVFGYTRDQVLGRSVMEIHDWENIDPKKLEAGLEQISIHGGHVYQVNREVNGSQRIIESRASGIKDEVGGLVGYVLMSKDITESKQAENLLVKSERKYRLLMEYANDAIFVADTQTGIILDTNMAGAKLVGRSVDKIIGMHQSQLHPTEMVEEYKTLFEKQVRFGSGVLTDIVVQHKDGRHVPVEIRAGVTDLGDSQVIQGIFRDVTERKKVEDALKDNKERLSKAQEIAHLGNWEWDIIKGTLFWSDEVYRIFGLEPFELSATYDVFLNSVHPDDRATISEAVTQSLESPDIPYDIQHRVIHPSGEVRVVRELAEIERDAEGKAVRMMGIVHDITELKEAEDKLKNLNTNLEIRVEERTHQLESANRELEAFSYSVAHDLRAPLNNTLGFSKILLEEYQDQLGEEGSLYLQWLDDSSWQMKRRIEDYLKLARSTRSALHIQQVNLSDLIEKAVISSKKIHIELASIKVDITPDLIVPGDIHLLTVVAENLISNAIKFTGNEENGHISFGVNKRADNLEYYIKDNGIGFDTTYIDKLFEPFERLHDPGKFDGSGIGLTTVQRIIHRHGGKIWAESTVNKGSTFYFTLGV
ncbi:MAG: PAS domain S-box protein, partial [Magnetococcales bacterium]|nr:PAS domain S-box protein [Magnetococcales bacterium]